MLHIAICDDEQDFVQHLKTMLNQYADEIGEEIKVTVYYLSLIHIFGGLLEHTLSVVHLCQYYCKTYPILNHDLLVTAAMLHDIGKTVELSQFPMNDYTDDGQLLGHIMIGAEMIHDKAREIPGFPKKLESELTVSYTHLDVYKRQRLICTSTVLVSPIYSYPQI